jgi:SAM-dependent methyltransferase
VNVAPSSSESTREFYAKHAREFVNSTVCIDLQKIYRPFLSRLPVGAHVLDAGCGSGRDTRAFIRLGIKVTSIDASPELAQIATTISGQRCEVMAFQDMTYRCVFDGIWACASLLHVSRNEMPDVLERFARALKPNGILYVSIKEGDGEEVAADGRFFSYFQRHEFQNLLTNPGWFRMIDTWVTVAADSSGSEWPWLNFISERTGELPLPLLERKAVRQKKDSAGKA